MTTENKEWDFGTAQAKVKIQGDTISWSLIGNGGSSYPLRSVSGVQYETAGFLSLMGHLVFLASGGENKRVKVPKSDKSAKIIQDINDFLRSYHASNKPETPPTTGLSIADELSKLAGLRDAGVLTNEEFTAQKAKLLAG